MAISTIKDTADIRAKLLEIWRLVDRKEISVTEARLHIGMARAVLDTLKVEIAAAHLNQSQLPGVAMIGTTDALSLSRKAPRGRN
jgi:predicted DNA-binding protein (UPF0251 family)